MNIPISVAWEIALVVISFILGTLWGHHAAIGKRVTYAECHEKRKNCPCFSEVEEIQNTINKMHPRKEDETL